MRSTILDDAKEDREKFNQLLKDADVFFANKRPGFLKQHGLDAESLCAQKPGLIHAIVAMHGEKGPWANRPVSMRLVRQCLASLRSKVPRLGRSSRQLCPLPTMSLAC